MDEEKGIWRWKQAFLLLVFVLINSSLVSGKQRGAAMAVAMATEADYQALKSLKLEFIDTGGALSSWNGTRAAVCSTWAGITCLNGRVVVVQLPWKGLEGRISDGIGLLRGLRHLSLHDNALTGPIPPALGELPQLRGLYLFNNGLSGSIPSSLGNCLNLQILDLSSNNFSGAIPSSIGNCSRLYRINLSFNKIVGNLPDEFGNLLKLGFLDLSNNGFSGDFAESLSRLSSLQILNLKSNNLDGLIPPSIGKLTNLSVLDLSNNTFKGQIPISLAEMQNLAVFDVSYNDLSGAVPSVLASRFNSSSFVGNLQLCGYSSSTTCPSQEPQNLPSPAQSSEEGKRRRRGGNLRTRDVILIAAGGALLVVLLITCCVLLCCLIGRNAATEGRNEKGKGGEVESGGEVGGKLVHFDGPLVFAADDLLCASAEIMGKSAYGTAYRATMEDSSQVAVKRLREKTTKAKKEFEVEAAQLGRIRHPNVLPLRAYYIGPKGEKLLVYDYVPRGSLASFLHGRGPETAIPWPTRMGIATGVARGLSHLHGDEGLVHGNLSSGNVLVDEKGNPLIADAGLSRLVTPDAVSTTSGSIGYRAPELVKAKDATAATAKGDVYGLGVIMLELLTGKSPSEVSDGLGLELPQWVASIVKEEWTNEVFDVELMRDAPDVGEELLNVLKLALHCVDPSPEVRPRAADVLQKLEELRLDSIINAGLPASFDEAGGGSDKEE